MGVLSSVIDSESELPEIAIHTAGRRARSCVIVDDNLSRAWVRALATLVDPGVEALTPLVVTVTGFDEGLPREVAGVRTLVDDALAELHAQQTTGTGTRAREPLTCQGVANTIFPGSMWSPGGDRQLLYKRYLAMVPRLKRRGSPRGLYFERLISYGRGPENGNQLEHIIKAYNAGLRRTSAFQATICDPQRDATRQRRLGFPCLQQVALYPHANSLSLTGFYGTQYVLERAYGNFLGLCWLGRFLAHEMGLTLNRMTCIASYAPFSGGKRTEARQLVADVEKLISINRRNTTDA